MVEGSPAWNEFIAGEKAAQEVREMQSAQRAIVKALRNAVEGEFTPVEPIVDGDFGVKDPKGKTKQQEKAARHFEQMGEDRYQLTVASLGIQFEIDRLRRDRHELVGLLCVRCALPGALTFNGALSTADFNPSSARARTERANLLASRARSGQELDWLALMEEFCGRVLEAERAGQPARDLREFEKPTSDKIIKVDGLIFPDEQPSCIFGDGGSLKSYTGGVYVAGRLAQLGRVVLLVDWELDGPNHRDRHERIFATDSLCSLRTPPSLRS